MRHPLYTCESLAIIIINIVLVVWWYARDHGGITFTGTKVAVPPVRCEFEGMSA